MTSGSINLMNETKRILLLSANQFKIPYPVYPIGISYLATYLRPRLVDYDIKLADLNLQSLEELKETIRGYSPKYIGVSLRNIDDSDSYHQKSFIEQYLQIVKVIREVSSAKIILGGSGFSIFYRELYDTLGADFGIIGEGEEGLYNLITALDADKPINDIQGLVFREEEAIVCNDKETFTCHLNFSFEKNLIDYYWKESGLVNIQTKRGCPYNCIYCSYPFIEGKKVRTLDQDLIIDSLKEIKKKEQGSYIFFTDSVFNLKPDYNRELAEKMIQNDINMKWMAYFSPSNITKEDLQLFKRSGLTHIEFGTDALSDVQLKNYNKRFTVEDVLSASRICDEVGVYFAHFLILGGVGETAETIKETLENSKRFPRTVFFPFVGMRIFPNTPLYYTALEENVITEQTSLLTPHYYISKNVDLSKIEKEAHKTGKKWVFPTEMDVISEQMKFLRSRNKKGPLWEFITR